jgi:hypothetical protein
MRYLFSICILALTISSTPLWAGTPVGGQALCSKIADIFQGDGAAVSSCYNKPEIKQSAGGYTIHYREKSSGIVVNIDTKCTSCFLIISGKILKNKSTLRLRLDAGDPTYIQAPDGTGVYDTNSAKTVEIYLYQDQPFAYELKQISLVQKPPATATNSPQASVAARRFLEEQLNWRGRPLDLSGAIRVLRWAAALSDYGYNYEFKKYEHIFNRGTFWEMKQYFDMNIGGAICGGHSVFLSESLRQLGYEATTLNFGTLEKNLTHVVTLIHIQGKFFILDPTFNAVFRDNENFILDFETLLTTSPNKVIVDEVNDPLRLFLVSKDHLNKEQLCGVEKFNFGSLLGCSNKNFSLDFYFNSKYVWGNKSKRFGITAMEKYINLLKVGVFRTPQFKSREISNKFITLLNRLSIPIHPTQ